MTTPDLEGLAREHEEIAHCAIWEAIIELGNAHQTGFFQTSRQDFHLTEARDCYDMAVTHRQAAALIRSAPAPGREEISNEIHIALQRLHYADLSWIAGSADGFERATLAIADHLLSALFHAPADPGGGREGVSEGVEVSLARIHALAVEGVSGSVRLEVSERMKVIRDALASPTPPAGDGWRMVPVEPTVAMVRAAINLEVAPDEPITDYLHTPGNSDEDRKIWEAVVPGIVSEAVFFHPSYSHREFMEAVLRQAYRAMIEAASPTSQGEGRGE